MCVYPRLVGRRNENYSNANNTGLSARASFFYNNYLVPCGHCSDCLKKRQNDLAARCALEANRKGSMIFVTLTYEDSKVPLSVRLERVKKDTGEILYYNDIDFLERGSELDSFARSELSKLSKKHVRYVYSDLFDSVDGVIRYCITQSLCRRDVQLWLKAARVAYKREFGSSLSDFSYVCCGEYGPNTARPHYHIAFFGLDSRVVFWLCQRWQLSYGFTYVQKVNSINKDGSNGYEICSRYIGKYMSKGCFECESVKNGSALKPRLMCSIGLGNQENNKVISDNLLAYYRCYNLVGEFDINNGLKKDGSYLSSADYDLLASEVVKRSTLKVGDSVFPIPNRVKHYIWYEKNAKGYYVSSIVRREIASRLQFDFFEDFVRKCTKDYTLLPSREITAQINEFIISEFSCNQNAEKRSFASLQKFYKQSKF